MGYKKTYREQTEELPYDFYMQLLKDLLIEKDGAEDSSFENEWENEDDYDDFEDIIEEELPGIDEFRTINQLPFFKEKVETVYQLCKEDRIKDANRICCGLVEAIGIVFLKKKYSVRVYFLSYWGETKTGKTCLENAEQEKMWLRLKMLK